jgi:predicted AlkP superfamily phosphohydrolase/phosphomutase
MILIVGLDGATFDLAGPWIADGTLPHLGRLMRSGAHGRLQSTTPPATFPSWTSFMTGVNPGRHGVFDFTCREPGTYRVRFVNGSSRKAATIWEILSQAGRRVCVLGVPGTYPPEPVNGCMISGFDTPVTTRSDASFVYPAALAADIEALGGFPFADFQEFSIGAGWHARALESMLVAITRKQKLAESLARRERWDCLMLLFGESDTVAHHFWAFHDRRSPRYRGDAGRLTDAVRTVYAALDAALGRLMDVVQPDHVLVVSDHGFGGAGDSAVFLNRFLAQQGFLRWLPGGGMGPAMRTLRQLAVRMIPEHWQARLFRLAGGRLASAIESRVRFGGIDWAQTRAASEELNYFPSIWLNVAGRDPHGIVPADQYDRVCAELRERLLAWRDPIHGGRVVRSVRRRDAVYRGPWVTAAPDLLLELETPGGYSHVCLSSAGRGGDSVIRIAPSDLVGGKLRGMSGSHRSDGLFVLAGDRVTVGELAECGIADMAPTILALCDVAIPDDWDGRLLSCVTGAAQHGPSPVDGARRPWQPYSMGEEACLEQRLVRLGYLE